MKEKTTTIQKSSSKASEGLKDLKGQRSGGRTDDILDHERIIFAIAYDTATHCVKIGNLTIPVWLLTTFVGAGIVLMVGAMIH